MRRLPPVGSPRGCPVLRERRERPDESLVHLYLNEVGRHALLTKDDEARLARAMEAGPAARDGVGASVGEDQALSTTEHGRSPTLLGPLDEREREILRLRFGLDHGEPRTLEQVAQHFQLTRERIRQIEAEAMSKLRHPSVNCGVQEFLTD
ncbi:MAG: sigma factor-like helix-turn-helix DNA-binding protein [Acidimicrobiales bacterium]